MDEQRKARLKKRILIACGAIALLYVLSFVAWVTLNGRKVNDFYCYRFRSHALEESTEAERAWFAFYYPLVRVGNWFGAYYESDGFKGIGGSRSNQKSR